MSSSNLANTPPYPLKKRRAVITKTKAAFNENSDAPRLSAKKAPHNAAINQYSLVNMDFNVPRFFRDIVHTIIRHARDLLLPNYHEYSFSYKYGLRSSFQESTIQPSYIQFSHLRFWILENSLMLFETIVRSKLKAWAAVSISRGPIVWPLDSSDARISP
jgi:hypothetical protein